MAGPWAQVSGLGGWQRALGIPLLLCALSPGQPGAALGAAPHCRQGDLSSASRLLLIGGESGKPAVIGSQGPTSTGPAQGWLPAASRQDRQASGGSGRPSGWAVACGEPLSCWLERRQQEPRRLASHLTPVHSAATSPPLQPPCAQARTSGPQARALVNKGPAPGGASLARPLAAGPKWQRGGRWTVGSCTAPHTKFNQQPTPGPPPDWTPLQPLMLGERRALRTRD